MLAQSILICAIAAVARAQSSVAAVTGSTTVSPVMPAAATQAFMISNTSSSDKFNWCHAQLNTCPQICGGSALVNKCDAPTLTYACECNNGTVPDCTAFTETLPFYICQATYGQCINAHMNDAQGQQTCKDNEKCGTRNATAEAVAQSSAAGRSSSTAASSASGSATAASTASSSAAATSKAAAVANNQNIATGATAAVLLAAMKLFF